jgi:hypothetical protein
MRDEIGGVASKNHQPNPRGFDSAADLQGAASCCSSVISQLMFQMGPAVP